MTTVLMIITAVASAILIAAILLQSSNSDGLSGAIGGGAEQLFGKKKSKGYEAILRRISTVTAVVYIALSLVIVTLESHGS
ncbi:MAG: preprotein translocase subunit SecG [Anaerovoracaceae bacterium]